MKALYDSDINELLLKEIEASGNSHILVSAHELQEKYGFNEKEKRAIVFFFTTRFHNQGGHVHDSVLICGRESKARYKVYKVSRKPQFEVKRKTLFTQ